MKKSRSARIDRPQPMSQFGLNRSGPPPGQTISIRAARLTDVDRLQEMEQRSSPQSLYYRYLHPKPASQAALQRISQLEPSQGQALVAQMNDPMGEIVGLAYYLVDAQQPDVAEPAILVEDGHQHKGIGKKMLQELTALARARGIRAFACIIDPANFRIRQMIRRSGLPHHMQFDNGTLQVRIELEPAPGKQPAVKRHDQLSGRSRLQPAC